MIYLDNGATSFRKPPEVFRAVRRAMAQCANPGRGGYEAAMAADRAVYRCRETAADLFSCRPEQVALTMNCTHGLNIAIRSLVKPGAKVVTSGFEHNAVVRPLHALGARVTRAGKKLFDWEDTLEEFDRELKTADAAVFTHVSNVFGYILPVEELAKLCRMRGIPFILDAAQSAGTLNVSLTGLGADFIAMPGHKGLLGPQGTGLLLCAGEARPLLYGGTGTASLEKTMPQDLPERLEAGTLNVAGYAGLQAGMSWLQKMGMQTLFAREHDLLKRCAGGLARLGMDVYTGPHQASTLSFRPGMDCEEAARLLAEKGFALRAGLHCAPQAHEAAGTLDTGTIRLSLGYGNTEGEIRAFLRGASDLPCFWK